MKKYIVYVDEDCGEDIHGAQVLGVDDVRMALRVMKQTCAVTQCKYCDYRKICHDVDFSRSPCSWAV